MRARWMWSVAIATMVCSMLWLYPVWTAVLGAWFAGWAVQARAGWAAQLGRGERRWHLAVSAAFPVAATAWKWVQLVGGYSDGGIPNRLQHLVWSASTVALLLPLLTRWWRGLDRRLALATAIGAVTVLGVVNELLEYVLRVGRLAGGALDPLATYRDTMADLLVNFIGAALAGTIALHRRSADAPAVGRRKGKRWAVAGRPGVASRSAPTASR